MSKGVWNIKAEFNQVHFEDVHYHPIFNVGLNIDICRVLIKTFDPYVPYDTGALSKSVFSSTSALETEIVYSAPYASKCYYGEDIAFHKDKHPLATAYWDKVAMQNHGSEVVQKINELFKARINEVESNG